LSAESGTAGSFVSRANALTITPPGHTMCALCCDLTTKQELKRKSTLKPKLKITKKLKRKLKGTNDEN